MALKNIPTKASQEYRNFPMVPRVVYGKGSFNTLGDILMPKRKNSEAPMIFLVDDVFEGSELINRIPSIFCDQIILISAEEEPKTNQVDALVSMIRARFAELPSGIIGIGGGTLLDLSKAVAIMLTNKGSASEYQGWDLVQKQSIYHVGIPTISGTGAEVSRTTVLLGPEKKLGINSDFTTFDQVVLDPELTKGVPKEQWFYTGMDCFIHCIESLNGTFLNAFSKSYGEKFQYLEEFYPQGVALFNKMRKNHQIVLPKNICSKLSESEMDTMISVAMGMEPLWENALGENWKSLITVKKLKAIYQKI